jgi:hypothetical protein
MRYGNEVRGVGTNLGIVKGDHFFRMPTRRISHPERVVRPSRVRLEEVILRVQVGGTVSAR